MTEVISWKVINLIMLPAFVYLISQHEVHGLRLN